MNILAPINDSSRIEMLIDAGADEFFFGFYNEEDLDRFGKYFELNRMSGFGRYANKFSYEESIQLIKKIKETGKDCYVTLNSSGYTESALNYLEKYVKGLIEAGVTGIIVSCPEMLNIVKKYDGRCVISCVGTVYNSSTVRFYKNLGADRVIVPRDLSMSEIEKMIKEVPDMEYETFIMRNGCILSDGNCLGLHQFEYGGICSSIRKAKKHFVVTERSYREQLKQTHTLYDHCLYKYACAMCAIYRMVHVGISACKVVGRVDKPDQVLEDIKLVNKNRNIAVRCSSEREFLEKMVLPNDYKNICEHGYSCYFPEIVNPRVR